MKYDSCTNCMAFIVGKAASATGRVLLAHNEDDFGRYTVRHGFVPPRSHAAGETLPAEPGRANIPQVERTYGFYWSEVLGAHTGNSNSDVFINECGVALVSDSAMKGRDDRADGDVLVDGGIAYNIRRAVAERAASARDAAHIIRELAETWGYAPGNRMYIAADANEAFVVELARGRRCMGARVPDDAIVIIPNHFTLRRFSDADEVFGTDDLRDFAVERGWLSADAEFDFSVAYQRPEDRLMPVNVDRQFHGLRLLTGGEYAADEMPFCVRATRKYDIKQLMDGLSQHYEGTADDTRFGPWRNPHYCGATRICRDSTIESVVVEFGAEPEALTAWTAFGRPCQQLYIPLHPLATRQGAPDALGAIADPVQALEKHLQPGSGDATYQRNGWQVFKDFGNMDDFFFGRCEDAMREFRDEWYARWSKENARRSGSAAEFDARAVSEALSAVRDFAARNYSAVEVSAACEGDVITVEFACPAEPDEGQLIFGLGALSLSRQFASAKPGSLKRVGEGRYRAQFDKADAFCVETGSGEFDAYLGIAAADGQLFAGMALLKN